MPLLDLPNELLLETAEYLDRERDINALCRVNRRLYLLLNATLYNHNARFGRSTALRWAAAHGHEDTLRVSLAQGADVEARSATNGCATALWLASEKGHKKIVEILVANGADINAPQIGTQWYNLKSPLLAAFGHVLNERAASVLVECGANVLISEKDGTTVLHRASYFGLFEIVKQCLENGATVDAVNAQGRTALHYAAEGSTESRNSLATIKLLLKHGASIDIPDSKGRLPENIWKDRPSTIARAMGSYRPCEGDTNLSGQEGSQLLLKGCWDYIDRERALVRHDLQVLALFAATRAEARARTERQAAKLLGKGNNVEVIPSQKEIERQKQWAKTRIEGDQRRLKAEKSTVKTASRTKLERQPVQPCRPVLGTAGINAEMVAVQARWTETRKTADERALHSEISVPAPQSHCHHAVLASLKMKGKSFSCRICGSTNGKKAAQCLDCGAALCASCRRTNT